MKNIENQKSACGVVRDRTRAGTVMRPEWISAKLIGMRKPIFSSKGAPPKGIYTPAIVAKGSFVFVSGQGPVDPKTGEFVLGSFREQAQLTFSNVGFLLEEAGSSWDLVVKVNVYLTDMGFFAEMNEVYKTFFKEPYPARTTVGAGLGRMMIEVDCVALVP